jgi:hypothetical protein
MRVIIAIAQVTLLVSIQLSETHNSMRELLTIVPSGLAVYEEFGVDSR